MGCCSRGCGLIVGAVFGAVLAILGGILFPVGDIIIEGTVKKEAVIEEGTTAYDNWVSTGATVYREFWLFDVQNSLEVVNDGAKPVVKEKGPYIYRTRYLPKTNISFSPNHTVSFVLPAGAVFQRDMSVGPEEDKVTSLNLAVSRFQETLDEKLKAEAPLNKDSTEKWNQFKILMTGTAKATLGSKKCLHHDWFDKNDEQIMQLLQEKNTEEHSLEGECSIARGYSTEGENDTENKDDMEREQRPDSPPFLAQRELQRATAEPQEREPASIGNGDDEMRQVQEKCLEQNLDLYSVFINLTKAFDTINREALWSVLVRYSCPRKVIQMIRLLHDGMTGQVLSNGVQSDPFEISSGVKQDHVLAPVLFNLFFTCVLRQAVQDLEEGVYIHYQYNCSIFDLRRLTAKTKIVTRLLQEAVFADYCVLMAHKPDDLLGKTEVLVQSAPNSIAPKPTITIDDTELKTVESFKYLVSVISSDGFLDKRMIRDSNSSLFQHLTVKELLWGYTDPMLNGELGLFHPYNGTNDGLYNIHTGKDDISKVGMIDMWKGEPNLDFWSDKYCDMINGTDASSFAPFVDKKKPLFFFSSDICRSVPASYEDTLNLRGIEVYRFALQANTLASPVDNPDNRCFCRSEKGTNNCTLAGVLDISSCQSGRPVFISLPHFLHGSPSLWESVEGLNPNVDHHKTFLDVEPITGFTLRFAKRIQVNMMYGPSTDITVLKKVKDYTIFPLVWMNETATLDEETANMFKEELFSRIEMLEIIRLVLLCGGLVIFVICLIAFFIVKHKDSKKIIA
ncbi:platelet glycoprotein 4 [Pholidichthys leucotaenia]